MRRTSKLSALALVIVLAACGGSSLLKSFRVALASSSPLVNSLVSAGAIPESRATAIIADFDAGAQCGLSLQDAFTAAKDLPAGEQKAAKFQASSTALSCFRQIINRQNFAAHKRVQDVANIAEGILASMEIFYSPPTARAARPPAGVVIANDEKDLEKKLKAKVEEMERLLKAQ